MIFSRVQIYKSVPSLLSMHIKYSWHIGRRRRRVHSVPMLNDYRNFSGLVPILNFTEALGWLSFQIKVHYHLNHMKWKLDRILTSDQFGHYQSNCEELYLTHFNWYFSATIWRTIWSNCCTHAREISRKWLLCSRSLSRKNDFMTTQNHGHEEGWRIIFDDSLKKLGCE